jgi:hypothetical protein
MITKYDPNQEFSEYPEDELEDEEDISNNSELDDYEVQKILVREVKKNVQ